MWERIKRFFAGEVEDALGELGGESVNVITAFLETVWCVASVFYQTEVRVLKRGLPWLIVWLTTWAMTTSTRRWPI